MSNLARPPVREIDGDTIEKRVQDQRAQLCQARAILDLVTRSLDNLPSDMGSFLAGERVALGVVRDVVGSVLERLDSANLRAPADAQEVAYD